MNDLPARLRLTPEDIKRHREYIENDPERKLSPEARSRVRKAWDDQLLLRHRALAKIELRWQADSGDVPFGEYLSRGQAWVDLAESHVAAARLVLQTTAEELWKLALPRREFREAMENQIEGAVYSLELHGHQKLAIETEFGPLWTPPEESAQPALSATAPISTASRARGKSGRPPGEFSESGRKRVEFYCSALPRGREQLAEKANINSKSIHRLINGEAISRDTWNKLAKAMGTSPDELLKP